MLVTVVVPTSTPYLVGELSPMEREAVAMEAREGEVRRLNEGLARYDVLREWPRGRRAWHGGADLRGIVICSGFSREAYRELQAINAENELRRIAAAEELARLDERVLVDRMSQVDLDRTIRRFSIVPAYSGAVAALAGTDLASYRRFLGHAQRCRQSLIAWLRQSDVFSTPLYSTADDVGQALTMQEMTSLRDELDRRADLSPQERKEIWQREIGATDYREWDAVDLSRMPACRAYRSTLAAVAPAAALDLAVLLLANVVLLLLAVVGFLRREVV